MNDVIIIGGGPAGYTAALYSSRAQLDTLVIEKMFSGGQMATTDVMENYPGFEEPIGGPDLALRMEKQARKFGTVVLNDEVLELELDSPIKKVKTKNNTFESKTIILSMGASPKMLGLPKEEKFRGSGVSYCAVCDGAFFRGKTVAVVGGGDTAAEDALYLARFCPKVYIIHRRDTMRATKILQNELCCNNRIEFFWDSVVEEIEGQFGVEGLKIKNIKTGEKSSIDVDGLFVAIGLNPNNSLVKDKLELTKEGYVITDDRMRTNIPGVFAAGDLREKYLRQVITAAADGASAAYNAEKYIIENMKNIT
ncbi:thioredoxin-disulfide reductase [Ruminiclostridium cellulolyticum]|uniref:Thioredoxin reductase n=1 Tax=Ruminiclostridium cellulolyticum (strain ATCC 35319 / DSM 5812 / JCM 6584 / H10) TaxID=394503 RepID=B8I2Y7_RUMCH|nr:thioredoxin-disulfide reductase [Ruminiclostridium cellulolyticum]ACL76130.1 thioredoxin reductase [Ruminiclostridium cellulolyticum H10]